MSSWIVTVVHLLSQPPLYIITLEGGLRFPKLASSSHGYMANHSECSSALVSECEAVRISHNLSFDIRTTYM